MSFQIITISKNRFYDSVSVWSKIVNALIGIFLLCFHIKKIQLLGVQSFAYAGKQGREEGVFQRFTESLYLQRRKTECFVSNEVQWSCCIYSPPKNRRKKSHIPHFIRLPAVLTNFPLPFLNLPLNCRPYSVIIRKNYNNVKMSPF